MKTLSPMIVTELPNTTDVSGLDYVRTLTEERGQLREREWLIQNTEGTKTSRLQCKNVRFN